MVLILYIFAPISRVNVPVLAIKYSSMATSFPASLPYPDSLIPPNGDSAHELLPGDKYVSKAHEVLIQSHGQKWQTCIHPDHPRLETL